MIALATTSRTASPTFSSSSPRKPARCANSRMRFSAESILSSFESSVWIAVSSGSIMCPVFTLASFGKEMDTLCRCVCPFLPRRHHKYPSYSRPDLPRSEEHTSELQSRRDLVCRLLLEKKKKKKKKKNDK